MSSQVKRSHGKSIQDKLYQIIDRGVSGLKPKRRSDDEAVISLTARGHRVKPSEVMARQVKSTHVKLYIEESRGWSLVDDVLKSIREAISSFLDLCQIGEGCQNTNHKSCLDELEPHFLQDRKY